MAPSSKSKTSTPPKPRSSKPKSSVAKKRSAPAGRKKPPAPPRWQDWLVTRKPEGVGTRGGTAIRWIEANCVHTNDRWTGKPFRLLTWQKLVILALFTVRADGLRTVRWALIGIAKKNGKTELLAALALFFAFGPSGPDGKPEPSALVIVAAGSDDQADTLFAAAKTMAELSPTLADVLETFESEIICPELPGSKIKRVAAAAKKTSSNLDGPNIYVVICDELHCWEGALAKVVWDTLTNGGATRLQPMVLQITTAGFDKGTICGEQYAYGKAQCKLKPGADGYDPAYYFWWVEPPAGKKINHRDADTIRACNPSFGTILGLEFYLDQLSKKTEAVFRRYFLNEWTEASESWLGHGTWEKLSVGKFEFEREVATYCAVDAATKHDSTALDQAQWHQCSKGCPGWKPKRDPARAVDGLVRKLRIKARLWEQPFDPRTHRPLEDWRLPSAEIENEIRSRHVYHGEFFRSCSYDPAHFHRSAEQLEAEGVPMEDFPQTDARMVPAAQTLYQLIVDELLEHDGDPDFARHMHNAVAVQARGGDGGWRLSKGRAKQKMDAAVSAAMVALDATYDGDDEGETELW